MDERELAPWFSDHEWEDYCCSSILQIKLVSGGINHRKECLANAWKRIAGRRQSKELNELQAERRPLSSFLASVNARVLLKNLGDQTWNQSLRSYARVPVILEANKVLETRRLRKLAYLVSCSAREGYSNRILELQKEYQRHPICATSYTFATNRF